jgi:hypothetical protein
MGYRYTGLGEDLAASKPLVEVARLQQSTGNSPARTGMRAHSLAAPPHPMFISIGVPMGTLPINMVFALPRRSSDVEIPG